MQKKVNRIDPINYQAGTGGQNLKIRWTTIAIYNPWGNVTLHAASLSGGGGGGTPPPTNKFQISSFAPHARYAAHIAENSDEEFVAVRQSHLQDGNDWRIFACKDNSDGTPQDIEFQVNTYTVNNQFVPRSAIDSNENVVFVWEIENQDGSICGIYGRRYDPADIPLSGEFQINTYTANNQSNLFTVNNEIREFQPKQSNLFNG